MHPLLAGGGDDGLPGCAPGAYRQADEQGERHYREHHVADNPHPFPVHVILASGSEMIEEDLTHEQTRKAVRLIMDRTKQWFDEGGAARSAGAN